MYKYLTMILVIIISCVGAHEENRRQHEDPEIKRLKDTILKIEGTITMISNFVAGDFSNCDSNNLPPFETKICQISQTATADQLIRTNGQLNRVISIVQESLYGEDCINDSDVGCPVAGSIVDKLANIDPNDITDLQTDVTTLESSVDAINDRLDDFDGSGSSIETIISGLESDIVDLETRVSDIEDMVSGAEYFKWVFICEGTTSNNEPVLIRGDGMEIRGYVSTTTQNGMGVIATANVSGHQFLQTSVSPKCNFKIYDLTTSLKVCWKNTDRTATTGNIDTACDFANSFATPLGSCSCRE